MKLQFKRQIDFFFGYFLVATNLFAAKLLGFVLRRNHSLKPEPKNIIFIKILGLGSVLMAADAINEIRRRYPNAKLILVCGKGVKPGLEPLGIFDEFYIIQDNSLFQLAQSSMVVLWKCWGLKRRWVADLEVYSKLTTIFSLWTCARNRFGFQLNPVRFRLSINTHNVYFNQFLQAGENYSELAKAMGTDTPQLYSFPNYPYRARTGAEKIIAINNTCSELGTERKMPDTFLNELCRYLIAQTDYQVVLTGAPSDYQTLSRFVEQYFPSAGNRISVIAGKLSFQEYYDFLYNECRMLITIDSAPLHIAYRLKVPMVSLWGPTNPSTRVLDSDLHKSVYLRKNCSPCVHHTEVLPCGGDNTCMKDITLAMLRTKLDVFL